MDKGGEKVQSLGKSFRKLLEQEQKKKHKKANKNTMSKKWKKSKSLINITNKGCVKQTKIVGTTTKTLVNKYKLDMTGLAKGAVVIPSMKKDGVGKSIRKPYYYMLTEIQSISTNRAHTTDLVSGLVHMHGTRTTNA